MCNTNFSGRTYGRTDVQTYRQCSLQGHSLPFVLLLKSIDSGYSLEPLLSTDTWGQLVLLTTIPNHKICINTSRQVLEKILFAINAIFFSKESIDSE